MKNRTCVRLCFLLAIFIFSSQLYALQIVAGPCLEEPTETSITVMWLTDANCTSWVEYGTDESLGQRAINSHYGLIDIGSVHKITIHGLKAGTTYYYKICSKEIVKFDKYKVVYGENVSSPVYHFTTFDRKKKTVSFIVFNDIHRHKEELAQMLEAAKEKPYDLVFLNGDTFSYLESRQQMVENIIQPCAQAFAKNIPMVYVRGNHEARGGFARQLHEYFTISGDQYYGSFDHGPVHFVVIDCPEDRADNAKLFNGLADFGQYNNQQLLWLEKEIKSHAFRKASFRVVLMHIPVDVGPKVDFTWLNRQKWMPLFEKGKVDVIFCGHTHQPEIVPPKPGEHSYPVVIGGGVHPEIASRPGDHTTIRVDGTPDALNISIIGFDDKIIDSCTLAKKRK